MPPSVSPAPIRSFVIPARNEEGAVEEALSALLRTLRAAATPYEIILVDDGSTDTTALLVQALAVRHPEIRLVQNTGRHGSGTPSRACNHLLSPHFNLTVEMPLKAIVRGYSCAVVPIRWTNRRTGISKLKRDG